MQIIIWMCALGIAAAVLTIYYNSRFAGIIVRKLLEIDAKTPESALTLEEIGLKMNPMLRFVLRRNSALSNIVLKTEDGKYYINSEREDLARRKYRDQHITIFYVLLLIFIIVLFAAALTYFYPDLKALFEEKFGNIIS